MALKILLIILFGASSTWGVIKGILITIGFFAMFKKSNIKSWWAFIPCAKDYQMARCAGREMEGRVLSVCSFMLMLSSVFLAIVGDTTHIMMQLVIITFAIVDIIYSIRVYLGLCEVYGRKKLWVVLWLGIEQFTAIYWGFSKAFQPKWQVEDFKNDALMQLTGGNAVTMDKGLTVNLTERTVKEFFHKKYLLRDIHMYIKPGSMVLLLGGSGAGKTTFLNAVNGYEKAKAKVVLNGKNVYGDYKKMQYEIGFVPQQELMRGKDTVYSTLMDAAKLRLPVEVPGAERRKRVEEVMKIFGLTPIRSNLVEKLSGGQKKRLSIAMEYISSPSLFILDEPDSGLDGVMARELMVKLREIADQGKIVIVITHTPDRVIDLFDNVIVLAKDSHRSGRLAFYGSIEEAREFFGKENMEEIVLTINREEEGGEGRADEFVLKYAESHSEDEAA